MPTAKPPPGPDPRSDDEIPELGDDFFRRARPAAEVMGEAFMEKARRRPGRPRLDAPKEPVSLRLDAKVVAHLRALGDGWQTKVNAALAELIAAGRL